MSDIIKLLSKLLYCDVVKNKAPIGTSVRSSNIKIIIYLEFCLLLSFSVLMSFLKGRFIPIIYFLLIKPTNFDCVYLTTDTEM